MICCLASLHVSNHSEPGGKEVPGGAGRGAEHVWNLSPLRGCALSHVNLTRLRCSAVSGRLSRPIQLFRRPTACEKEPLRPTFSALALPHVSRLHLRQCVTSSVLLLPRGHSQISMGTLRSTLGLSHNLSGGAVHWCQRPPLVSLTDTDASDALM